jgi:hypothetical protein
MAATLHRTSFTAIFALLIAWISFLVVANELGVEPIKLLELGQVRACSVALDGMILVGICLLICIVLKS